MGRPLSLDGVRTYPLAARKSKVSLRQFARPHRRGARLASFLDGLPRILAGETLLALRDEVLRARARRRPVIWGLGAHVIKVGLSPVLIDLMERGLVTAIAMNGAGVVHDFEVAVAGRTSEDVEAGLGTGAFGMARETGEEVNRAIAEGDRDGLGLGAAVGRYLSTGARARATSTPACWPPPGGSACPPRSTSRSAPTSSTCTRPATPGRSAAPPISTSGCSPGRWPGSAAAASTSTSAPRWCCPRSS